MSVQFQPFAANLLIRLEAEPERSSIIHVQKSTGDLVRFGEVMDAKVPQIHQERAFSSPIWYAPG